jgi:hypothetical protein
MGREAGVAKAIRGGKLGLSQKRRHATSTFEATEVGVQKRIRRQCGGTLNPNLLLTPPQQRVTTRAGATTAVCEATCAGVGRRALVWGDVRWRGATCAGVGRRALAWDDVRWRGATCAGGKATACIVGFGLTAGKHVIVSPDGRCESCHRPAHESKLNVRPSPFVNLHMACMTWRTRQHSMMQDSLHFKQGSSHFT